MGKQVKTKTAFFSFGGIFFSALFSAALLGLPHQAVFSQELSMFVRGDANLDAQLDISDAVFVLLHLFRANRPLPCPEGANANDDLGIDIADPIYLLQHIFLAAPPPRPPFPNCGLPMNARAFDCGNSFCPKPRCSLIAHGCMERGVECSVFKTADGERLVLVGHDGLSEPEVGWCGTVTAEPCEGCASICQQGQVAFICSLVPDVKPEPCPLTLHGCGMEGPAGCSLFRAEDGQIFELSDNKGIAAPKERWCGTLVAEPCSSCASSCSQVSQVPILSICSLTIDSPQPCPLTLHGCIEIGLGCSLLKADDGLVYELSSDKGIPVPEAGWCGTVVAEPCLNCASVCSQGPLVSICSVTADPPKPCPLSLHGKVLLLSGCVVFQSEAGKYYQLLDAPPEVQKNGWIGTIEGKQRADLVSICMQGPVLEVCGATPDTNSGG